LYWTGVNVYLNRVTSKAVRLEAAAPLDMIVG